MGDTSYLKGGANVSAELDTLYGDLSSGDFFVSLGTPEAARASDNPAAVRSVLGVPSVTAGLDNARPAASTGAIGTLYTATDSGVVYLCASNGAGGARWQVWGSVGSEGRDTTAVAASSSCVGATTGTLAASSVASVAIVFGGVTAPGSALVVASVLDGNGWQIELGNNAADRWELSVYRSGLSTLRVALGTISAAPTAVHCLALRLEATATVWSLDGSTAASVSHVGGTATSATTAFRWAGNAGGFGASVSAIAATLWSTSVGNADLAAITTAARAAGTTPGRIPAVAGATELFRHHAGWGRDQATRHHSVGLTRVTWSAAPSVSVL